MKKILLILLFSISVQFVFAQLTQAEINKMMKEAQKDIEKMKKDPKMKELMKDIPNMDTLKKGIPNGKSQITDNNKKSDNNILPDINTKLISAIPKNTFTKEELVIYLNDLYKQLTAKINPSKIKAVDMMISAGSAAYKNNLAAVLAWYNGADEEAVLIAAKAAIKDPGNDLLLNNLSAILNMGGLEQKAIPILRTLLQRYPDNPMVSNNMGQAFAGLGSLDTAMLYLGRCIAKSPYHPEANNTAGQIELSKKKSQTAQQYFENSLKGSYNNGASNALRRLNPNTKYTKFIRPRVHIPEYFNLNKYKLPRQCENLSEDAVTEAEHIAYKNMLDNLITKYDAISNEETDLARQTILKKYSIERSKNYPPFWDLATTILPEIITEHADDLLMLDKYNKNFDLELKNLEIIFRNEFDVPLADRCAVTNKYLPLFAILRRDWQTKNIEIIKKYLDEEIYWSYLSSLNIHDFRMRFYSLISTALANLKVLAYTGINSVMHSCDWEKTAKQTLAPPELTEPECPFTLDIKFIVGKLSLDCQSVSFSGGEGFVFKYDKKFKSGQSTISLGIGTQLELGGGFGGVNIGASAGANESLFITLDNNGHPTDAGLKFGVKADAGAEIKGEIGKSINIKKDISNIEAGVGYTIGIESGIKFNEGPLKNLLNPSEKPVNKNVPVYKHGD